MPTSQTYYAYVTWRQGASDNAIRSMTNLFKVPDALSILLHSPVRCEKACFGNVDERHTIPRFFVLICCVDALLCGGVTVKVGKHHIAVGLTAATDGERICDFTERDATHALTKHVDKAFDTGIGLIIVRWIVTLFPKCFDFVGKHTEEEDIAGSLSFLKGKEKELLQFLMKNYRGEFTPIEVSRELSVTNKTIINRLAVLVKNGFVIPILVKERIRSYELSEFTRDHETEIMKMIGSGKRRSSK